MPALSEFTEFTVDSVFVLFLVQHFQQYLFLFEENYPHSVKREKNRLYNIYNRFFSKIIVNYKRSF